MTTPARRKPSHTCTGTYMYMYGHVCILKIHCSYRVGRTLPINQLGQLGGATGMRGNPWKLV